MRGLSASDRNIGSCLKECCFLYACFWTSICPPTLPCFAAPCIVYMYEVYVTHQFKHKCTIYVFLPLFRRSLHTWTLHTTYIYIYIRIAYEWIEDVCFFCDEFFWLTIGWEGWCLSVCVCLLSPVCYYIRTCLLYFVRMCVCVCLNLGWRQSIWSWLAWKSRPKA